MEGNDLVGLDVHDTLRMKKRASIAGRAGRRHRAEPTARSTQAAVGTMGVRAGGRPLHRDARLG